MLITRFILLSIFSLFICMQSFAFVEFDYLVNDKTKKQVLILSDNHNTILNDKNMLHLENFLSQIKLLHDQCGIKNPITVISEINERLRAESCNKKESGILIELIRKSKKKTFKKNLEIVDADPRLPNSCYLWSLINFEGFNFILNALKVKNDFNALKRNFRNTDLFKELEFPITDLRNELSRDLSLMKQWQANYPENSLQKNIFSRLIYKFILNMEELFAIIDNDTTVRNGFLLAIEKSNNWEEVENTFENITQFFLHMNFSLSDASFLNAVLQNQKVNKSTIFIAGQAHTEILNSALRALGYQTKKSYSIYKNMSEFWKDTEKDLVRFTKKSPFFENKLNRAMKAFFENECNLSVD